ncbi:uncharacterized protein LOC129889615 [Solanum dulcamara]|uniref:uncharacterized protein LOC129889615 n=1 Tax=Solanum dulcamara TaxID=45834 RepID=UPI002486AD05|nr:uncharacterized protein LOC129889615 [Solanum dulcamara]
MDSCNSGSVQSSSGDDQEYDSHNGASPISTFLNSSSHFGSISSSDPLILPQFLSQQPSLFDPHDTQNFNSNFQDSTNVSYNNDLICPKEYIIRSNHPNNINFNNFGNLTSSNIAPPPPHQGDPYYHDSTSIPINPSIIVQPNVVKNPRKRSRASRRAPTTVLTTNTTNFRQMVQEFTGIPTSPFTGSAYTRRFDLFSNVNSAMKRSAHLDTLWSSTQKVQNSQFMPQFLSSSMINNHDTLIMPTNNSIVGTTTNVSTFDQINKSFTSTIIPSHLDEMGMNHHDQISSNLGGFDQCETFGGDQEQSRKDRNISRLLFDGNI